MIRLTDVLRPATLTDERVQQLTEEFKATGKAVWKNKELV
jgi:hypothetical protein